MKKHQYLEQQNGTYYIRKTLNPEQQGFYGKKVIKHSLHTKNLKEAIIKRDELILLINTKSYSQGEKGGDLLSNHIDEYIEDSEIRATTIANNQIILLKFKDIVGDIPIKFIDIGVLRKYKRFMKSSNYKPSSINLHFTAVKVFLKWLFNNEYMDYLNYSTILKFKKPDVLDTTKERFTDAEVLKILEHCEQYREHPKYHWRYYLPLLYFYTGCRFKELTQLTKADIYMKDGQLCIELNTNIVGGYQKTLKNKHSKRVIPLHPIIHYSDFVFWLDKQTEEGFIFGKPDGRKFQVFFSSKYQGINGGLLTYLNITNNDKEHNYKNNTKTKTLHSARHSFTNKLKQNYVQYSIIDEITGHVGSNKMVDYYSNGHTIKAKYDAIKLVTYDLGHDHNLVR